jgi:DNA polymerase III delta prime subunit
MIDYESPEMPQDQPDRVHRALKAWHTSQGKRMLDENTLDELVCAYRIQRQQEIENPHLLTNRVLMVGMERLKRVNTEAAGLLERRFLNEETAREVAYSLNTTPDSIYHQQRTAIVQLAQAIWRYELESRQHQALQVESRLPPPSYTKLFGVDDKVAEIEERLNELTGPWILALEGMGGVGKTSLAHALARKSAYGVHFKEIAWISAQQRLFRLTGEIEDLAPLPSLTFEGFIDQLIDQFGLDALRRRSSKDKLIGIKAYVQQRSCLIFIDNLETLTDYRTLVTQLRELVDPSKVLITTRYSLRGETGVYISQVDGLSREETFELIRYEAANQGLTELAEAPASSLQPIYDVAEGNPLATKLIIGQVHTFPLPAVLERLRNTKSKAAAELADFVHLDAWRSLDERCRRIMKALLLVPEGGGRIEQIATASELSVRETATSLQHLTTYALVNTRGGLNERRYGLHPLTHSFVKQRASEANH